LASGEMTVRRICLEIASSITGNAPSRSRLCKPVGAATVRERCTRISERSLTRQRGGRQRVLPLVLLLAVAGGCAAQAAGLKYWIEPCEQPGAQPAETGCKRGDPELAQWAMEAWQSASDGKLRVQRTTEKATAIIKIYWVPARAGLYGETRGGDVFVRPVPGEGLLREATVYLTCVHEAGHALGLAHTANFDDIMYNFQYGGDIMEYFARYVRKLSRREDIRKNSGISPNDRKRLAAGL
jgi:hypothetical protein